MRPSVPMPLGMAPPPPGYPLMNGGSGMAGMYIQIYLYIVLMYI